MTDASIQALQGLRDLATLKWYVIPLLAIVAYIYTMEIKKARETGIWDAILSGLTVFGMDFFNETWNGWVFHLSGHSAFWTTPGDTALRTAVGWNLEIMFMFSILGIIYYHSLLPDRKTRILGLPNRWFFAILFAAVCVFIECVLNYGGHLVWEYPWWERTFAGVWLIFIFGYFEFFVAAIFVLSRPTMKSKLVVIGIIYAVPLLMNIVGLGVLGFTY